LIVHKLLDRGESRIWLCVDKAGSQEVKSNSRQNLSSHNLEAELLVAKWCDNKLPFLRLLIMQFDSGCVFHHSIMYWNWCCILRPLDIINLIFLTCGKKHFWLPFLPGFEQMLLDPKCTFGLWNVNMLFWMRPKKF